MIKRRLFCLLLGLSLGLSGQASASSEARLESIKQHALALYTVGLANQQQFSNSTVVLVKNQLNDVHLQQIHIRLNGQDWEKHHYNRAEANTLIGGQQHQLGIAPLSAGEHVLQVQADLIHFDAGGKPQTRRYQDNFAVRLGSWPRGFQILFEESRREGVQIKLRGGLSGEDLLEAARFELATKRYGQALTLLQNLAQIDPAITQQARYSLALGESLEGWGLERAAEAMLFELSQTHAASLEAHNALIRSAELALSRKDLNSAQKYLNARTDWPKALEDHHQVLENRILAEQKNLGDGNTRIAEDAPLLGQFNLAVTLLNNDQTEPGEKLLHELGRSRRSHPVDQQVSELANVTLGYRKLNQGQGEAAADYLALVPKDSPYFPRARLGQGWAAIVALNDDSYQLRDDGLRPAFAQRIDRMMQQMRQGGDATSSQVSKAMLKAIESWTDLRDGDPLDPYVQEALVAIPYALAQMGEMRRAAAYGDIAVRRLEGVREALFKIYARARKGDTIDALLIANNAWPPYRYAWRNWTTDEQWWLAKPAVAPENAHMHHLLTDPDTLYALRAMTVLNDAEIFANSARNTPSLQARSQQLLQRIEAERTVQQRALNRFVWSWLDTQGKHSTRYLILARLVLAQASTLQERK